MAGTAACQHVISEQLSEVTCGWHGNQALEDIGLIDLLGTGKRCPFVIKKFYGGMWPQFQGCLVIIDQENPTRAHPMLSAFRMLLGNTLTTLVNLGPWEIGYAGLEGKGHSWCLFSGLQDLQDLLVSWLPSFFSLDAEPWKSRGCLFHSTAQNLTHSKHTKWINESIN